MSKKPLMKSSQPNTHHHRHHHNNLPTHLLLKGQNSNTKINHNHSTPSAHGFVAFE